MERERILMKTVEEMIDFLETDTLSATFTPQGLKYLSLRNNSGTKCIDLKQVGEQRKHNPEEKLLIEETLNFLKTGKHNMPLDLTGFTDFQRSVFDVVSKIEPGEIITYKGVAELLGKPGGAQAVGNAIVKNPVAYFLPTHRVLPAKGIGICRTGAGFLREKLLLHEGHDLSEFRGNYVCNRKKCCLE